VFAAWGRFVYRRRWAVLAGSLLLLGLSIFGLVHGGVLNERTPGQSSLEADRAGDLMKAQLSSQGPKGGSSFLIIFKSESLPATDSRFRAALETAVAPLQRDSRVTGVMTPYNVPPEAQASVISRDGHEALVSVSLKDDSLTAQGYYSALRAQVHSSLLSVQGTGGVPINRDFTSTLEGDLQRAELISLPGTLVLLLLIFASVVAALLPLGVGVLTILGGLSATLLLARATFVSQYAPNIVILIGLGVSIDYSLFIVNRFREELARGVPREQALGITMATAGRAITFSGLTVAVGLSSLLFFQGSFLASMGALVVGLAILYALSFLPALLAIMGGSVDRLRLPVGGRPRSDDRGFWHGWATWVMRRPVLVLVPALGFLLLTGTPFLSIRLANGDVDTLPPRLESRQGYDTLVKDFPGQDQTTFTVVVDYGAGDPRSSQHVAQLESLSHRIGSIPGVLRVAQPLDGTHIAVLDAVSNKPASSDDARNILSSLRAQHVGGARLLVGGQTALDVDVIHYIAERIPYAVGFVVLVTLVVLFALTGSAILPVKAVVMNLASISASFGALVWIFQQGHLSTLLGFTPQSLDPTIPVILFSIVFGLSMDYEVLLLSRIQEEYRRSGDTAHAVAMGLQRSGRLITGAAAIMVAVFVAFGLGEVVIIKAIGVGLAIAVALDATVVRALVVPAVMRLLGDLNWWAPKPLAWLHQRLAPRGARGLRGLPAD
jgi:uncharacterized membrane protein YdfJ with MMPL/SSD domain